MHGIEDCGRDLDSNEVIADTNSNTKGKTRSKEQAYHQITNTVYQY